MFGWQKAALLILLCGIILAACISIPNSTQAPVTGSTPNSSLTPTAAPVTVDQLMETCPTAEEIAFIDSRTQIIFKADPTAPQLVCTEAGGSADLTLLQKNIYNIFRVMQQLKFDLPLPWTDSNLFDWFTGAVTGVVFDPEAPFSRCCDKDGRILIETQFLLAAQTDLWVDSYYGGAGVGSLLPMLVHEARHAEGYAHDCSSRPGSDLNPSEMGAWAVEHYLDLWIADHSSHGFFADYQREISHANAELIAHTRFCPGEVPPWFPFN